MTTPSSVHPHSILRSSFGRAQTECAAMCITNYLRDNDLPWDTEFTYWDFSGWAASNGFGINDLYLTMASTEGGLNAFVTEGLNGLVDNGYVNRDDRNDKTHLKVTKSFIEMMQRFAA